MRPAVVVLIALAATGCAARKAAVVQPPAYGISKDQTYHDVRPGSRVRVITPLTKSGSFRVKTTEEKQTGLNIELRTNPDFLGYETAFYRYDETSRRMILESVDAMVDGKPEKRRKPAARNLFAAPRGARFLRLVFLTRSSAADHDMAVLNAPTQTDLEAWTVKLKADPAGACRATKYCSWIPAGIAVTIVPN